MIEKSCACGTSKKNFQRDIGAFYVDECCLKAGFDEFGKPPVEKLVRNENTYVYERQIVDGKEVNVLVSATPEQVEKINAMEVVKEENVTLNYETGEEKRVVVIDKAAEKVQKDAEKAAKKAAKDAEKKAKEEAKTAAKAKQE